jgi:hypothetical protein
MTTNQTVKGRMASNSHPVNFGSASKTLPKNTKARYFEQAKKNLSNNNDTGDEGLAGQAKY